MKKNRGSDIRAPVLFEEPAWSELGDRIHSEDFDSDDFDSDGFDSAGLDSDALDSNVELLEPRESVMYQPEPLNTIPVG